MDRKEKLIKKSLVKAVSSVRKKFRALHNARSGAELKNVELFKPITGKPDALIDVHDGNRESSAREISPVDSSREAGQQFPENIDVMPFSGNAGQNSHKPQLPSEKDLKIRRETRISQSRKKANRILRKYSRQNINKKLFENAKETYQNELLKIANKSNFWNDHDIVIDDTDLQVNSPQIPAAAKISSTKRLQTFITKPRSVVKSSKTRTTTTATKPSTPSTSSTSAAKRKETDPHSIIITDSEESDDDDDDDESWKKDFDPTFAKYLLGRKGKYVVLPTTDSSAYSKRTKDRENLRDLRLEQLANSMKRRRSLIKKQLVLRLRKVQNAVLVFLQLT